MSYLFYIDESKAIVLRPDCYKLSPELSVLNEKELLMIILIYDYHSIYRQFPEADRKRKAMVHVWGESKAELFDKQTIKNAIEAYKSIQYDTREELVVSYQRKIDQMLSIIETDNTPTGSKKALETIDLYKKAIRELHEDVSNSVAAKGQIKGNQELSFIEELMKNQKYYNSVIAKK